MIWISRKQINWICPSWRGHRNLLNLKNRNWASNHPSATHRIRYPSSSYHPMRDIHTFELSNPSCEPMHDIHTFEVSKNSPPRRELIILVFQSDPASSWWCDGTVLTAVQNSEQSRVGMSLFLCFLVFGSAFMFIGLNFLLYFIVISKYRHRILSSLLFIVILF
jgi:hypothetical protein